MVVNSDKIKAVNYTYGSVAYDFDNKSEKIIKKNNIRSIKIKNQKKVRAKAIERIAVLFVMSLFVLYRFSYIIKVSNNISMLKTNIKSVQSNNEDMIIKIAVTNNNNIEDTATNKLGMIKTESKQVIIYDTNSESK